MEEEREWRGFADLECYSLALQVVKQAYGLASRLPDAEKYNLAAQVRRSAASTTLNIAEGYGKRSTADRSRFYDIARGSAHECGAVLDASRILNLVDDEHFVQGKTLLVRIVSMLVKMTQ